MIASTDTTEGINIGVHFFHTPSRSTNPIQQEQTPPLLLRPVRHHSHLLIPEPYPSPSRQHSLTTITIHFNHLISPSL